jgi:HKD family nuclease
MQKGESLEESIIIVKTLGSIYKEENLRVDIDFDPNDGMTMVKYEDTNTGKKTIFINSNNKTISGIDTSKFWLPDYSNIQKANKKVIRLLEGKGYIVANLTYRNTQKSEE